jgi:glutamate-ammonia-ligase adenylyltransferase
MSDAAIVDPAVAADLCRAYDYLRSVEHRVQMLNDEQTHRIPVAPEKRMAVARLCGQAELAGFEADVARTRERVHGVYSDLFAD